MTTKQANHLNFTKASVEALPTPESGRVYYYDTKVAGLAVGVGSSGIKTYVLYKKINRRPERVKIGRVADLTVDEARKQAEKMNGRLALGDNPADEKRLLRAELTFGEMFVRFYEEHSLPFKKTAHEDQAKFHKYLSDSAYGINLSLLKLSDATVDKVRIVFTYISKTHKVTANRVLALISAIFGKAIRDSLYVGPNPCRSIKRWPENDRDRFIERDEFPAFFSSVAASESESTRDYVILSLLTGARKTNVLQMRWSQFDQQRRVWLIPETKNNKSQRIPLVPEAIAILERRKIAASSEFVFAGSGKTGHLVEPKRAWKTILTRAGMKDMRLHDLRRTFGSWQAGTGASLSTIGHTLNHKSLSTTRIYARLWDEPVREAMQTAVDAMFAAAGRTAVPPEEN